MIPLLSFKPTSEKPTKKFKLSYTLEVSLGHPSSACNGYCCFDFISQTWFHLPCFGEGSECKHTVTIEYELMPSQSGVTDVTLDLIDEVDHADLPLPNRSVKIYDENGNLKYLNIPAQIIHVTN